VTLLLTHEDVLASVTMAQAIEAMEAAFLEEAGGEIILPPRTNMAVTGGWLRVGPVAMPQSGWMGFKAMNLVAGAGVRYQVHLYKIATGELLAIMDAQHLTTLRTGATSAVATRLMARPGRHHVALLGSGMEARAQLEAMQAADRVASAAVFSPTEANRVALANDFRDRFGMDIRAVGTAEEAVAGAGLVLAAVKSKVPVLTGDWLRPGMHVNSVGTARRDQRELDAAVFARSARIAVDTMEGVFREAGDAVEVDATLDRTKVSALSQLASGTVSGRGNAGEITLFKSVGTGIQDIALASVIYAQALSKGLGRDLGEFPYLKRQ
jgi:alanine dehydrogenase